MDILGWSTSSWTLWHIHTHLFPQIFLNASHQLDRGFPFCPWKKVRFREISDLPKVMGKGGSRSESRPRALWFHEPGGVATPGMGGSALEGPRLRTGLQMTIVGGIQRKGSIFNQRKQTETPQMPVAKSPDFADVFRLLQEQPCSQLCTWSWLLCSLLDCVPTAICLISSSLSSTCCSLTSRIYFFQESDSWREINYLLVERVAG